MRRNKIYLKAYFRKNLGDDMFVRCVAMRYPNVSFRICTSSKYAQPFKDLPNISNMGCMGRLIDRGWNKITGKQICKRHLEKKANATVHIGGSIFIEPDSFVAPRVDFHNPNLFILGCNFGPYKTEAYREYVFSRLQKARDVCFRDRHSYDVFSALDHVRVAPDVLFGYPDYPMPLSGHGLGISVISLDNRPDLKHMADTYYDVIAQTVDCCVQKGIPVKLFSFCADEGDQNAIQEIMKRSESKGAEICEYDGDIDTTLNELNACEYIIASRFHAMIIGWCLSKKVFPIIYSDKQLHVMNDVGYLGASWDLRNAEGYTCVKLMESLHGGRSQEVKLYQLTSKGHFEKLDGYLADFI